MTKAGIVSEIAKTTGIDKTSVLSVVEQFMTVVKDSLSHGENVYLRGFGSFIMKSRADKTARDINKNTTIIVPAHNIPAFKPADAFKEEVAKNCLMAKIKNLIFDFDGTFVDTAPLIIRTMKAAMKELELPEKSADECRATIGLRLEEIPSVLWPETPNLSETYAATYRRIFDELKRPINVECFPDVVDSLRSLHEAGYRMAIASSRSHKSLEEYVDLFGLTDCFAMLIGGNDVKHGKPAPDPVLAILDAQKWNPEETLTIGDAPVDILMGKSAGTLTCGVTYGNSSNKELATVHPDFLITSFKRFRMMLQ